MKRHTRVFFKSLYNKLVAEDGGQVAVLMAGALIVLAGMVGLSVDVGSWYRERQDLQSAADAGALAGAQELLLSQSKAQTNAYNIANQNDPTGTYARSYTISFPSPNIIEVDGTEKAPTYFAQLLGLSHVSIHVVAKATYRPPAGMSGLTPLGLISQDYTAGADVTLVEPSGSSTQGNFDYLNFQQITESPSSTTVPASTQYTNGGGNTDTSNGDSQLSWYIQNTNKETLTVNTGYQIDVKNGADASSLDKALQTVYDNGQTILYVPVVNYDVSNNIATVVGFAVVQLDASNTFKVNQPTTGKLIQMIGAGNASPTPATSYGAEVPVLLQ